MVCKPFRSAVLTPPTTAQPLAFDTWILNVQGDPSAIAGFSATRSSDLSTTESPIFGAALSLIDPRGVTRAESFDHADQPSALRTRTLNL